MCARAVGLLRVEGLVVTEHGRGSFVRTRRPPRRLGSPRNLQADEEGHADDRLLGIEVTGPPAEVAARLGLARDELALARRHLLLHDGQPAQLVDRYLPLRVARPASAGQAERIAHAAHAEAERAVEELTVRMPSPAEERQLGMSGGAPVVVVRTSYDASGNVVEVADLMLAGDRHVLVHEIPVDQLMGTMV